MMGRARTTAASRAAGCARIQVRSAVVDARCAAFRLRGAGPHSAGRVRAEGLMMITPDAKPKLPRGVRLTHNEAQGGWVLLAPERVFKAEGPAAEIIKRCDGQSTFGQIVDDLVKTYNAPRDRITTDVSAMLTMLVEKQMME